VNFADKLLISLADPNTRGAVFDQTALEQIASAAYDTSQMSIGGPYNAVFEELQLGLPVPKQATAEGQWGVMGASERIGANFNLFGVSGSPLVVDGFWRGYIVARVAAPTGKITTIQTAWPDTSAIDREIIAALGALPADPAALEAERRTRLIAHFKAAASEPNAVTDAVVDRLLSSVGAPNVNEFFERYSRSAAIGGVQVTIAAGPPQPPFPKPLSVAAALIIRDASTGLAQLLADSRLIREQLDSSGLARTEDTGVKMLRGLLVIWILPATIFDDADWPGATSPARRLAAGTWLAREGIGLATVA
jgi:hypothetical protein